MTLEQADETSRVGRTAQSDETSSGHIVAAKNRDNRLLFSFLGSGRPNLETLFQQYLILFGPAAEERTGCQHPPLVSKQFQFMTNWAVRLKHHAHSLSKWHE